MKVQIGSDMTTINTLAVKDFSERTDEYAHMNDPIVEVPAETVERWQKAEKDFWDMQSELEAIYQAHWKSKT